MVLLETILAGIGLASSATDIRGFIREKIDERMQPEDVLAELVEEGFREQMPRLEHLCPDGAPLFHRELFTEELRNRDLVIANSDGLLPAIMPILKEYVSTPGATCGEDHFLPVYESVLNYAISGMWRRISGYKAAVNQVLLEQNEEILKAQQSHDTETEQKFTDVINAVGSVDVHMQKMLAIVEQLATYAQGASHQAYDQRFDSAPPSRHKIAEHEHLNPFTLARAEDFNHNYVLLARLFQSSPEWDSIQQREVNVW